MLTYIHFLEVYFTFAFLDCVRSNNDFVNRGSVSIVAISHCLKILVKGA